MGEEIDRNSAFCYFKEAMRNFIIILILISLSAIEIFAQEELKAVKILEYNEQYNFIIIDLGEIDGIKRGQFYAIIKDAEVIGKIQVVKVRENISACDIKELAYQGAIASGDIVSIEPVKKIVEPAKKVPKKKEKEKVIKRKKFLPSGILAKLAAPFRKLFKPEEEVVVSEKGLPIREISTAFEVPGTTIRIRVNADKDLTFYTLRDVLREYHITVIHSNRLRGTLTAFKIADFTFPEELLADIRGLREKKIVYSVKLSEEDEDTTQIKVDMKMVFYTMKQKVTAKDITKGKEYKELHKILIETKRRAETLKAIE